MEEWRGRSGRSSSRNGWASVEIAVVVVVEEEEWDVVDATAAGAGAP
mgnify:CR=1 FL=1